MPSFGFVLAKQMTETISAETTVPANNLMLALFAGMIALFGAFRRKDEQTAFAVA